MRGNRVDLGLLVLFVLSLALATRIQADDGCVANQCVGVQPFVCSGAALVCKNYVGPDCGPCKGSLYTTSRCPNAGGQQNLWCADYTLYQTWQFCNNCPPACDLLVNQCAAANSASDCGSWYSDPPQLRKLCVQIEYP
jgi:hypothetical protein